MRRASVTKFMPTYSEFASTSRFSAVSAASTSDAGARTRGRSGAPRLLTSARAALPGPSMSLKPLGCRKWRRRSIPSPSARQKHRLTGTSFQSCGQRCISGQSGSWSFQICKTVCQTGCIESPDEIKPTGGGDGPDLNGHLAEWAPPSGRVDAGPPYPKRLWSQFLRALSPRSTSAPTRVSAASRICCNSGSDTLPAAFFGVNHLRRRSCRSGKSSASLLTCSG